MGTDFQAVWEKLLVANEKLSQLPEKIQLLREASERGQIPSDNEIALSYIANSIIKICSDIDLVSVSVSNFLPSKQNRT